MINKIDQEESITQQASTNLKAILADVWLQQFLARATVNERFAKLRFIVENPQEQESKIFFQQEFSIERVDILAEGIYIKGKDCYQVFHISEIEFIPKEHLS
jgi:hypothetical protein